MHRDAQQMWGALYGVLPPDVQLASWPGLSDRERHGLLCQSGALHPQIVVDVLRGGRQHELAALARRDTSLPWAELVELAPDMIESTVKELLDRDDVPFEFLRALMEAWPKEVADARALTKEQVLEVLAGTDLTGRDEPGRFLRSTVVRFELSGTDFALHGAPGRFVPELCKIEKDKTAQRWQEVGDYIKGRLGDDPEVWKVFSALRAEFSGTLAALCDVALGLTDPPTGALMPAEESASPEVAAAS